MRRRRAAKTIASSASPIANRAICRFDGGKGCFGTEVTRPIEVTVTCDVIGLVPSGVTEVG